ISDGKIVTTNLEELNINKQWLEQQLQTAGIHSIADVFYAEVKKMALYISIRRMTVSCKFMIQARLSMGETARPGLESIRVIARWGLALVHESGISRGVGCDSCIDRESRASWVPSRA